MGKLNLIKAFYKFTPYKVSKQWGSVVIKVIATLDPDFSESHLLVNGINVATLKLDKNYSDVTLSLNFREVGYRGRKLIAEILNNIIKGSEKHLGVKLNAEVLIDNDSKDFLIVVKNENSKTTFRERNDCDYSYEVATAGSLKLTANVRPFIPYGENPELEQIYREFNQLDSELQQAINTLSPERARIIKTKLGNFNYILSIMHQFDWRGVWLRNPDMKVEDIKEMARDAVAVLKHIILPRAKELLAEEKILS
jgi:hypothetical protein